MTRRVFKDHVCAVAEASVVHPVIIDLTMDEDEIASIASQPNILDLTADSN
jgi:hypothetical protein